MRPQYDIVDISIANFVIKLLNGYESFRVIRESKPIEVAKDDKFTKIEYDVELEAGEFSDWRIRKHLKAHNTIVYAIEVSVKLTEDGHIIVWPGSITFKHFTQSGRRSALKKLQPLIEKPKVDGYKVFAMQSNTNK